MFGKFIADRLCSGSNAGRGGTRPAIVIATVGVAMGLTVMILSLAITKGFRNQVRDKVTGFTQDVQLVNYSSGMGDFEQPVSCTPAVLEKLTDKEHISGARRYVEKAGILRTDSAFNGFILKGVGQEYDSNFLAGCLVEGSLPVFSDTASSGMLLLSGKLADRLGLSTGDRVDAYFMQDRIRVRRMTVSGIYRTNFSEYDKVYAFSDIHTLQQLNGWEPYQVTGVEMKAAGNDSENLYSAYQEARDVFDEVAGTTGEQYLIRTTEQINAGLFAWLDVLNVNVGIILLLMLGISGFTMISGLLIIIFERTSTIGLLKAMGSSDMTIRRIFLIIAARIVGRGMLIGDAIGIGVCFIQQRFHLIPLDSENYYLDSVPCELGLWWLLLLNVVMFVLSVLMLVGPSAVISRIEPSRSIRFD